MVAAERYEFSGIQQRGSAWRKLAWPLGFAVEGRLNGMLVTLVANGPGPGLAGEAFETALQNCKVDAVVSTGACGGLDPALGIGDVVVAAEVLDTATGNRYPARPLGEARRLTADGTRGWLPHTVASQDRVAVTIEEKRALFERGAAAVEMEAAGVAARAQQQGLPFSCIRAVSDSASEALPIDFNLYRDAAGRFRRGAIAAAGLGRPFSRIPALLRLHHNGAFASAKLGEFFANCCF